jgi:hypothetical protein
MRRRFLALDDALAAKNVPPLTGWWRASIGHWLDRYEQDQVLELWGCVGRGAAKSTALYKLALFFTIDGAFVIPPGEVHFAVVLSRLKTEAEKGIAIVDRWLALLDIPHHLAGDVVELDGLSRGIRVVAASVAATSGWRAFFVGRDERSKWPSSGIEEEDASETDTSAMSMSATHALAPNIAFGSAWGKTGAFYEAISAGSTPSRHVLGPAPTWVAAPHISEGDCRRKEPDLRRFLREYGSVFQAGVLGAFGADIVENAFSAPIPGGLLPCEKVVLLDPTAGGADAYAWATAGWHATADRSVYRLVFDFVGGVERAAQAGYTSDAIVAEVVSVARARGAKVVYSDQFEKFSLASAFAKYGLAFRPHTWTAPLKERAVEHVRRWLSDGVLVLPNHARLKHELLDFQERISGTGALTFQGRRGGHDDHVMLIMLAALVDIEGGLPGSPLASRTASPPAYEGGHSTSTFGSGAGSFVSDAMLDGLSAGVWETGE